MSLKGFEPVRIIDPNLWFVQVYLYWLGFVRSKTSHYAQFENLCHFVRVVLFWAPLRWFFETNLGLKGAIRPVNVVTGILCAILPVAILYNSDLTASAVVPSLMLGMHFAVGFVVGTAALTNPDSELEHGFTWGLLWVSSPLVMPIFLVIALAQGGPEIIGSWSRDDGRIGRIIRWLDSLLFWKVRWWMVVTAAMLAAFTLAVFSILEIAILVLLVPFVFLCAGLAGTAIGSLLRKSDEWFAGKMILVSWPRQITETVRVVWAYIVNTKKKFCPRIEFGFDLDALVN